MWCRHPAEERQRVYDGGERPVPGRWYCALCGTVQAEGTAGTAVAMEMAAGACGGTHERAIPDHRRPVEAGR
jgi:hypothetical protein